MSEPLAVSTNGTVSVIFVAAVADTTAPKLTEINAGSSVDLSCYLTGEGLSTETSENTIEDPRLCSKQVYEARGDYTDTMELTYVFNPESPTDDEARLALPMGTTGFIVTRWAVDSDVPFAVGDLVDVYPVEMGVQRKMTPARNAVHRIVQKPFVVGAVRRDVAVVAGP